MAMVPQIGQVRRETARFDRGSSIPLIGV